jgi:hypothetical protein
VGKSAAKKPHPASSKTPKPTAKPADVAPSKAGGKPTKQLQPAGSQRGGGGKATAAWREPPPADNKLKPKGPPPQPERDFGPLERKVAQVRVTTSSGGPTGGAGNRSGRRGDGEMGLADWAERCWRAECTAQVVDWECQHSSATSPRAERGCTHTPPARGVTTGASRQLSVQTRAVGKLFVVPAGAPPVPVSDRLYRAKIARLSPAKSRIYCRPKQFYCRPKPAAHLLPNSPGAN